MYGINMIQPEKTFIAFIYLWIILSCVFNGHEVKSSSLMCILIQWFLSPFNLEVLEVLVICDIKPRYSIYLIMFSFFRWASIIVTTLLIRGATVPLLINQLKATTKLTVCCFSC